MQLQSFFKLVLNPFLVGAWGLSVSLVAWGSEQDCLSLFAENRFEEAYRLCSTLDEEDLGAEALKNLGYMYLFGKGTTQNNLRGIDLLNKSSIKGGAKSSYILSQLYQEGSIVLKNEELADYYRHDAVDKGYEPAIVAEVLSHYQINPSDTSPLAVHDLKILENLSGHSAEVTFMLAECYRSGYGTKVDFHKAAELYAKSASYDGRAFLALAELYEAQGEKDKAFAQYQKAIENCSSCAGEANYHLGLITGDENFLQKAVALGYYKAEVKLGAMIIDKEHSSNFNNEDWLRAESYLIDGCSHNIKESCLLAAKVYFQHLTPSPEKNAYYISRLISLEMSASYELLAQEYLSGNALSYDENMAFELYQKAYSYGDLNDFDVLAGMYLNRQNEDKFKEVCRVGIEKRNINCQALLAFEDFKEGVNQNQSIKMLSTLASDGNGIAAFSLFKIYQSPIFGLQDHDKSFEYLTLASDLGHPDALKKYFKYLLRNNDFEQASKYLKKAFDLNLAESNYLEGLYLLKTEPNNLAKSLSSFEKARIKGSKEALVQIGKILENEHFSAHDLFKACSFYDRALDQNIKEAQMLLAHCLVAFHNSNEREILPYIEKAASLGDVGMITYLVNLYSDDLNGIRNDRELVHWITEGAHLGITDCIYRLGDLYLNGLRDVLDQNEIMAKKYLTLAMDQGSTSAAWSLSRYYRKKEQYSMSCSILERFAGNFDYPFASNFALCYINGEGRYKNVKKGEEILTSSYKRTQTIDTAYLLGQLYSDESTDVYSLEKALDWYLEAVDLGDTNALFDLGRLYEIKSPFYSLEKAFHYYSKSMEIGNMAAELKVAEAYYYGRGVVQNTKKGCDLAQEAVSYSISDANPLLASCFLYGQGREKSFDKAVAVLHDGDDNSNSESSFMLAELYSSGKEVDPDLNFACKYYYRSVISAGTLDEVQRGANLFLPGKMCYALDEQTYVVLSIYQKRYNTIRYQKDLLSISAALKSHELTEAKDILDRFMESDENE